MSHMRCQNHCTTLASSALEQRLETKNKNEHCLLPRDRLVLHIFGGSLLDLASLIILSAVTDRL